MLTTSRGKDQPSFENRMMRMADRLFMEFDTLPSGLVFGAINSARRSLAEDGSDLDPEDIAILARWLLNGERLRADGAASLGHRDL